MKAIAMAGALALATGLGGCVGDVAGGSVVASAPVVPYGADRSPERREVYDQGDGYIYSHVGVVPYYGYGSLPSGGYGPAYAYVYGYVPGPPSPLYRKPPRCLQEGYDAVGKVRCVRFDYPYDRPRYAR